MLCDSEAEEQSLIRAPSPLLNDAVAEDLHEGKGYDRQAQPNLEIKHTERCSRALRHYSWHGSRYTYRPGCSHDRIRLLPQFQEGKETKSSTKKRKRLRIRLSPEAIRRLRRARALLERKNRDDHALHAGGPCGSHL